MEQKEKSQSKKAIGDCWIIPMIPSPSSYYWPFWTTLKEKHNLKLWVNKNPFGQDTYHIALGLKDKEWLLASAHSEAVINGAWMSLERSVTDQILCKPDQEVKNILNSKLAQLKKAKPTPTMPSNEIFGDTTKDLFLTKFKLPKERILASYSTCTLFQKIPKTGTVYISLNYFVFSGPLISSLVIPFTQFISIEKEDFESGLPGAISLWALSGEYTIAVLFKRNEMYIILEQLWKRAMDNLEKSASSVKKEAESISELEYIKVEVQAKLSKESLQDKKQNEIFCEIFKLPPSETIHTEVKCTLKRTHTGTKVDTEKGTAILYASTSFLCFKLTHSSKVSLYVVPFGEIKRMKKGENELAKEFQAFGQLGVLPNLLHVFAGDYCYEIEVVNRSRLYKLLASLITEFRKTSNKVLVPFSILNLPLPTPTKIPPQFLDIPEEFSSLYGPMEKKQITLFTEYFQLHGNNVLLPITTDLIHLVRGGIPLGFKSALWQILSGSIHLMSITDKSYYQSLVDKQEINWNTKEAKGSTMADMKQIEKDLIRSLPKFQYFQKSNEGIGALRNVLRAYALHNPAIGYCQSMNIVTGSLLLFLEEEEAFYVLVSIISKVPEYYVRELLGSTVDTRIFNDLIAEKLPTLSEHFQKNFIDLTLVALSWFLCLYIDRIPWEAALRVMDCFIAEGPNILLQMGLAILSTHEEQLLKLDNIVSVKELLDTAQFDCTALCKLAFEELQVDHEDMNARRNYHKYRALQELHKRNNTNIFGSIIKKTKFNQSRVEQYYEEFKSAISIDSTAFSLHFDDFRGVFGSMVKWWPVDFTEFEKLFDLFDQHKDEVITFTEYMLGLDIIMHGSMIQHQQLVFGLYSENDHLSRTLLYQKALPLLSLLNYYRDADLNGQEKDDAFFPLFEFKPEEGEEMLDFGAFRTTSLAILKIEK